MSTSTVTGAIVFVEWHDATIDSIFITISSDKPSVIKFEHLSVYHQKSGDILEIWSYRATLNISGLQGLVTDGAYREADYVSEARLYCDGLVFSEDQFLPDKPMPVDRFEVVCGSGRMLTIHCRGLQLVLGDPVEHVEDWIGPLR
jgi:hypothetical protein